MMSDLVAVYLEVRQFRTVTVIASIDAVDQMQRDDTGYGVESDHQSLERIDLNQITKRGFEMS